ncbi:hypothetical protein J7L29_00300, partial [Candidatus Bathyarchaeota archaeon]|nr:hypothetical protein [Candidatus Bathyarchaeota archaeon]
VRPVSRRRKSAFIRLHERLRLIEGYAVHLFAQILLLVELGFQVNLNFRNNIFGFHAQELHHIVP